MSTPLLSIITVCYNAKNDVEKTIKNILQQNWKEFEYLVIDGGSQDGTSHLLKEAHTLFSQSKIMFRYISEPDKGIYDAMNKGASLAKGRWLLFLNAGDILADNHVLEHVFSQSPSAQIFYGDTLCTYQGNTRLYSALPLKHLKHEMAFCHQSAFIEKDLLMEQPYDISYKVCADHHFFLSMYLQQKTFEYYPIPIAIYEIAGFSDKHKMTAHKEQHRMQKELDVFHLSFSWLLKEILFYMKQSVKHLFGQKLIDIIRKKRLR